MTNLSWKSAAIAALLLAWVGDVSGNEGIAWTTDMRAAQETASRDRKLLLLHFYSDHCPPCKLLEKNVFPRPEVAAAIDRNFVPVKVHVDSLPQVAKRYHVQAWPTDLIVTPTGLEVFRKVGAQSAQEYVTMLDQVAYQAGVGAARLPENERLLASPGDPRQDVSLAAGSGPAGQEYPPSAYEPGARSPSNAVPSLPAVGNPHVAGVPARDRFAGQSQQAARPPAPGSRFPSTPPTSTDRWAGQAGEQSAPPSAGPATDSIYAGFATDSSSPPAASAPPARPGPGFGVPSAPAARASVYDPPVGAPSLAPRTSQAPPASTGAVAQRTSAQFAAPQTVSASQAPPMALNGLCPVTILESGKWAKGNVQFGAVHRQRTYLFVTEDAQRKFLADPDHFAPVLSGCDPVVFAESGRLIDGKHNIGLLLRHNGKMVFFSSEETLKRFQLAQQAYLAHADRATAGARAARR